MNTPQPWDNIDTPDDSLSKRKLRFARNNVRMTASSVLGSFFLVFGGSGMASVVGATWTMIIGGAAFVTILPAVAMSFRPRVGDYEDSVRVLESAAEALEETPAIFDRAQAERVQELIGRASPALEGYRRASFQAQIPGGLFRNDGPDPEQEAALRELDKVEAYAREVRARHAQEAQEGATARPSRVETGKTGGGSFARASTTPSKAVPAPPTPGSVLEEAVRVFDETAERILHYETDISAQINYPQIVDPTNPHTVAYILARTTAKDAIDWARRHGSDSDTANAALDVSRDFKARFHLAETTAKTARWDGYSLNAQQSLQDARTALDLICTGELTVEAARAQVSRIRKLLTGVIPVPSNAFQNLVDDKILEAAALRQAITA